MDFRPLGTQEKAKLLSALRRNGENSQAILMDRKDTSFIGGVDEVPDDDVINAIKSVPCHYATA